MCADRRPEPRGRYACRTHVTSPDALQEPLLPLDELALPAQALPPRSRRIYCNRDLRLDQIAAVGFDMDYTLAIYRQDEIDRLSIAAAAKKLVARGYPSPLLDMPYRAHFPIRGLLVDTRLGNVVKTDRYRYVKKAYHGTSEIKSADRKHLYQGKRVRPGPGYHSIDTLYALSEVTVFAAVVDALDHLEGELDYERVFQDVRGCIDEAHADGTIKGEIVTDLARYLVRDPGLPATLHKLRSAGKQVFLLTNSELPYTEAVMRFLLESGGLEEYRSWRSYFDVIVTDARKPSFFTEQRPLQEHPARGGNGKSGGERARGTLYHGGCLAELEAMLQVRSDHILYVGDHIFGDVLRAKKESSWRTLMIIQEMTEELDAMERYDHEIERLHALSAQRESLHDGLRDRQTVAKSVARQLEQDHGLRAEQRVELESARQRLKRAIERTRGQLRTVEAEHAELEQRLEHAYHPFWGSPFKAESELSSFGEQVERYACLYTDRVTNLVGYSPSHFFRGPRHRMAHE